MIELEDGLYPKGTTLKDVPPEFHGIKLRTWLDRCIIDERRRADEWIKRRYPDGPPLSRQREWRPADSYGLKSM